MATPKEGTDSRLPANAGTNVRVGGSALALGALLLAGGFALHPPPATDPAEFMATVADSPTRWVAAHAVTAIALSLFAIAGLVTSTARSRLTRTWWTTTAWAVLIVSALWVTTAAVVEATVIAEAAAAGDAATFDVWSPLAEAHSAAFLFFVLAVAVIAGSEARSADRSTPAWAAWIGAVAAVASFAGMILVFALGIASGGLVWVGSTIVMSLWLGWFGAAVARSAVDAGVESAAPNVGGHEPVR